MSWRLVRSLERLREQVRAAAPRSVPPATVASAWGTIGDAAHSSTSDHSPHVYAALGPTPVVCAADFPHAPALGLDGGLFAEALRRSRDPRIAYVIFNRRIFSSTNAPWTWRTYSGSDPHDTHWHVSVVHTAAADDTRSWAMPGTAGAAGGSVTLTLDTEHIDPTGRRLALGTCIAEGHNRSLAAAAALDRLEAQAAADVTRDAAALAAIQALAGDRDTAGIIAAVREEAANTRAAVAALQQDNNALRTQLAALPELTVAAMRELVGDPQADLSDEAIETALRRVFADAGAA
jgi:hypothetical protein